MALTALRRVVPLLLRRFQTCNTEQTQTREVRHVQVQLVQTPEQVQAESDPDEHDPGLRWSMTIITLCAPDQPQGGTLTLQRRHRRRSSPRPSGPGPHPGPSEKTNSVMFPTRDAANEELVLTARPARTARRPLSGRHVTPFMGCIRAVRHHKVRVHVGGRDTHLPRDESDHQQVDGQQQSFQVTDRRLRERSES